MSVGVILAAGGSQRLGFPKQLVSVNGMPFVCHSATQMLSAGLQQVVIVLGGYAQQVEEVLTNHGCTGIETIYNKDWATGQSSSLACGLRYVSRNYPHCYQAVVGLCDQPLIKASHLRKLIDAVEDNRWSVAATRYPSGGGVPAAIRRDHWPDLIESLRGDGGAKQWIRNLPSKSVNIIDSPNSTTDVDTISDLQWIAKQA